MQHILILSRDEEYQRSLVSLLKDNGYTVCSSDTIEDTIDRFYVKKLDLLIVDVESWKEEGIKTYKDLRHGLSEEGFSIIIIASMDQMREARFSLAFDDFAIKNEDITEILLRIKQYNRFF